MLAQHTNHSIGAATSHRCSSRPAISASAIPIASSDRQHASHCQSLQRGCELTAVISSPSDEAQRAGTSSGERSCIRNCRRHGDFPDQEMHEICQEGSCVACRRGDQHPVSIYRRFNSASVDPVVPPCFFSRPHASTAVGPTAQIRFDLFGIRGS